MVPQNKILISGGWGYGNLGDEVILDSTIRLLIAALPDSQLTVMTYNVEETASQLIDVPNLRLIPSIHSLLNNSFFPKFSSLPSWFSDHPNKLLQHFFKQNVKSIVDFTTYFLNPLPRKVKQELYNCLSEQHIFIQSGGGYFNISSPTSALARVIELEMASQASLKTLVIGQSIVSSTESWFGRRMCNSLKLADRVIVRDTQSHLDLCKAGITSSILPDLALENYIPLQKPTDLQQSQIGVILKYERKGLLKSENSKIKMIGKLINALKIITQSNNMKVKIMISRKWEPDIVIAKMIAEKCKNAGIACQMLFPEKWSVLQEEISQCCLIISQNLHGLIMAARAGVPFLAITMQNEENMDSRKIKSFLEQTGQITMTIDTETDEYDFQKKIEIGLQNSKQVKTAVKNISENINQEFSKIIKSF